MIDGLNGVTMQLVGMALDASQLRQEAIATNIANANSVGYTPLRVSFEDQLAMLKKSLMDTSQDDSSSIALQNIRPKLETMDETGSAANTKVEIDQEIARMTQNVVQYEALLEGLTKKISILQMAINEGKP